MDERERTKQATEEAKAASCSTTAPASEREPEAGDDAERLDVCSDKFDPLLALYSPNVTLPFPNMKTFNNVSDYESFLKGGRGRAKPENIERRRQKAMKGVVDPERIERLKRLMVNNPVSDAEQGEGGGSSALRRRRQKPQKNVLTRMPLCKGSPLGELFRCVEERIRVKVHIRTFKGLRGVCSGFVVAFDKFWNMAMVDVDETYREPLRGEALYHEKALSMTRLFEKLKLQETSEDDKSETNKASKATDKSSRANRTESMASGAPRHKKEPKTYGKVRTRHVNQLFIRGENIILVNPQPL